MRSGFSQKPLYQCSHWRASAYVGGPNLLTSEDLYQHHNGNAMVRSDVLGMTSVFCRDPEEGVCFIKCCIHGRIPGYPICCGGGERDIGQLRQDRLREPAIFAHGVTSCLVMIDSSFWKTK